MPTSPLSDETSPRESAPLAANIAPNKLAPEELSELTETHNNVRHARAALEQAHNALLRAQGAADHVVHKLARKYGLSVPFQVGPDGTLPSKTVATP